MKTKRHVLMPLVLILLVFLTGNNCSFCGYMSDKNNGLHYDEKLNIPGGVNDDRRDDEYESRREESRQEISIQ